MRRVAVFGNAGGGKSTLARRLAEITGLPLTVIDTIQYTAAGLLPAEEYRRAHAQLLRSDSWIIEGFGDVPTAWERFAAADTLVHVDMPLARHAWWVTKRLAKGLFSDPVGWPAGSPIWSSSLSSYRVLWPCHRHLTPSYRRLVEEAGRGGKRTHHLRSPQAIHDFLDAVCRER